MSFTGDSFSGRRRSKMRNSSKGSGRAIPIPLEPLKEGHRMDPQERLFLEAAEKGDKHTMIRCLQGPNPVQVNCTNILGRSAIQIAVDNENTEIVELLLKQDGVKIGDALLYAIREGVYRIVEMLIDHPSITREMLGCEWSKHKQLGEESSDYSPDISPVILAAHCNQFEILQLLLSRGAKIERPHQLSCSCKKCKEQVNEDGLRHSLLRIHTYRALASPAWISLTSADPVLAAFKLSWELERLAARENEFKDIYGELSDQCKKYACDLLDQCRSSEEVIAVLNKDSEGEFGGGSEEQDEFDCEKLTLARLKLALKYEQKQFVAHPHCQQLLTSIWYEGLPGWRKRNYVSKFFIIIGLISAMPLMAFYYLILPRSRIGQLLRTPFMKFMYHSASFGVFLLLLFMASTNPRSTDENETRLRQQRRGPPPSSLEWLIVFYVFGFIWGECKQLWEEGLKAYIRQWWNWLDFIMLSLYLCTFSLRIVAYYQSLDQEMYGSNQLPRHRWPREDPTLISEGVFAIANVFSFARVIYLFQANPTLGPLQISLGCMLVDIGKFLFIFFLVITSFACGLNQLYWYYSGSGSIGEPETNATLPAEPYNNLFDPIFDSCITLFWSLFGLTNLNTVRKGIVQPFTKRIGEYLLLTYHAMAIIVLINMLIAMMSSSFQDIEDHADREWKFARSKLWMGYFDEGSTLPPPFNIIISPKSVYYVLRKCKQLLCKCIRGSHPGSPRRKSMEGAIKMKHKSKQGMTNYPPNSAEENTNQSVGVGFANNHVHSPKQGGGGDSHGGTVVGSSNLPERPTYNGDTNTIPPKPDRPKYQAVMRRLVSRFIHNWKKQMRQDGVNEDDILEIKQDISSLRYELREDRKREAARTTGHIDNLKRDILRSLRTAGYSNEVVSVSGPPRSISPTMPHSTSGNFLSHSELDCLKREIINGLRQEIHELAREIAVCVQNPRGSPVHPPSLLPPINSELYHTHLYTQL